MAIQCSLLLKPGGRGGGQKTMSRLQPPKVTLGNGTLSSSSESLNSGTSTHKRQSTGNAKIAPLGGKTTAAKVQCYY